MLSSKKLTCKGTLRNVFIRVYRLEIQSVMLVFSTSIYRRFVAGGRGWGMLSPVGDHILQEF
jgi:hypothetical protein